MNIRADAKPLARDSEISLAEIDGRYKRVEAALSAQRGGRHWNVGRAGSHVQQRHAAGVHFLEARRKRAHHDPLSAEEMVYPAQIRQASRNIFIGALTGVEQLFFIDSLRGKHAVLRVRRALSYPD